MWQNNLYYWELFCFSNSDLMSWEIAKHGSFIVAVEWSRGKIIFVEACLKIRRISFSLSWSPLWQEDNSLLVIRIRLNQEKCSFDVSIKHDSVHSFFLDLCVLCAWSQRYFTILPACKTDLNMYTMILQDLTIPLKKWVNYEGRSNNYESILPFICFIFCLVYTATDE